MAVVICWDSLIQLFGEKLSEMIFMYFESRIADIPYENVYEANPHDLGCFKDKLCVNILAEVESIKA